MAPALKMLHRCLMIFLKNTNTIFCSLLLVLLLGFPGQAWALQSHHAPEGVYVHQLAHVFFLAALCYLFWDIRRSAFRSRAWHFLLLFCVFMALWNIVAFTGHWVGDYIDEADFVREAGYLSDKIAGPLSLAKLVYYFSKMDHIFSVPAMFCLYLCLRSLYRTICAEDEV